VLGIRILIFRLIFGREPTRHFTVFSPPPPEKPGALNLDRLDQAEQLVFVRDGFSWTAALFTPFWLLSRRAWLALLVYVVAVVLLAAIASAIGAPRAVTAALLLAGQAVFGFEAEGLERWLFERRGWRMVGSVNGRTIEECERRFFDAWLPVQPVRTATAPVDPAGGLASTSRVTLGSVTGTVRRAPRLIGSLLGNKT
jgi:hypothetical protein